MTDETSDSPLAGGIDGLDDIDPHLPDSDPIAEAEDTTGHGPEPSGGEADAVSAPDDGLDDARRDDRMSDEERLLTGGLDPEELDAAEEVQRAMEEARARLADVPAEVVVTNHVMGLYELAAIHLSNDPPELAGAALAIDAVACLVDGLGDRLGADAPTMRDALNNIRLAFVQVKGAVAADDT